MENKKSDETMTGQKNTAQKPQKVTDAVTTSQIQPTKPPTQQQFDTYALNLSQIVQTSDSTKKGK